MENNGPEIPFCYKLKEGKKMAIMQTAWEAQDVANS